MLPETKEGRALVAAALVTGFAFGGFIGLNTDKGQHKINVSEATEVFEKNFPNTKFDRVSYDQTVKQYVGEASETILYLDEDLRRIFVGEVVDLVDSVNLTDKRRKELHEVTRVKNSIDGSPPPEAAPRHCRL